MSLTPPAAPQPPIDALLGQARRLVARGDDEAAKLAYLNVLRRDPASLEALVEIARLALRSGHRSAARTAYQQAIFRHPQDAAPRVNLGNLLIETGEFEAAQALFAEAAALSPDLAAAHQGLARALTGLGRHEEAQAHWRRGFAEAWLSPQPYRGAGPGVRVLLLVSAGGGNIPTRPLLDDTVFAVTALYAEFHDAARPLPAHDVVFNAIGDADLCAEALAAAKDVVARSSAPTVNAPAAVALTTRAANARRLAAAPGVIAPQTRQLGRAELLASADLRFPLLVRSPGFHTGQHFVRVERREELASAVGALPGETLLAIEPLEARGADGLFRKYRVMLVGGVAYPLHLAVSANWKVHYFSAAMAEDAALRAEEAAFLADMPGVLGERAMAALEGIAAALGLDYAGVDFGLGPDGRLLLFEANPGMVIQPPGPEPIWDYRRAPIGAALGAVRALLLAKAASGGALRRSA